MSELRERLIGVWCFAVTPFRTVNGMAQIDPESSLKYGQYLGGTGLQVIVPCGGNGEFFALTLDDYKQHLGALCKGVAGRAAVVPGVGGAPEQVVEMARFAKEQGCPAVLAMPQTFPGSEEAMARYYEWLCKSVDVGVIIFQLPNAVLSVETLLRLAETCPNFVGVKEEIGDPFAFSRLDKAVGHNLLVIPACGEATVGVYYLLGAKGFTTGVCNLAPQISLEIHERGMRGDYAGAMQVGKKAAKLSALRGKYGGATPLKTGLMWRGILADDAVRVPLGRMPREAHDELRQVLSELDA